MKNELLKELLDYLKTDDYDDTCKYHIELIEKIEKELNDKKNVYVIRYIDDTDCCEVCSGVSYVFNNFEKAKEKLEEIKINYINDLKNIYENIEINQSENYFILNCNKSYRIIRYDIEKKELLNNLESNTDFKITLKYPNGACGFLGNIILSSSGIDSCLFSIKLKKCGFNKNNILNLLNNELKNSLNHKNWSLEFENNKTIIVSGKDSAENKIYLYFDRI